MRHRWIAFAGTVVLVLGMSSVLSAAAVASESTATAPPGAATRIEDDDARVVFRGAWTYRWDPAASGWSRRHTTRTGSSATLRFDGTGVTLLAPRRPDGGIARVTVDGSVVATVSLFAAESTQAAAVWSSGVLPEGRHTVTVASTGQRESFSAGSVVVLDAFDISGAPVTAAAPGVVVQHGHERLYRRGSWRHRESRAASGGSAMYALNRGSAVTLRFRGTAVTWLGRKSQASGKTEVLLDGRRVAIVGGAPGGPAERRAAWAATGLSDREHTLIVRALGEPSADGGGTSVDVDAFVVDGEALQAYRPTPFDYPWGTYIVIDKSDFRLYWVKNGTLRKVYPIAHGKVGWTTPNRIWRIDAKYHSSGVYGPRKMRLFKQVKTGRGTRYVHTAYGIHGTNQEWVIGTRASHGCIRMYNRDVLELFPQVPTGTMVVTRD